MSHRYRCFCILLAAITIAAYSSSATADLIVNGGFEIGDFTGWTLTNDDGYNGVDNHTPRSGSYAAYFGQVTADGPVSLTQTVTVIPGMSYNLSFWTMAENNSVPPNEFEVSFGGKTLLDLMDASAFPYSFFSYTITANSQSSLLEFDGANDISFFDIDDVSLVPTSVPEPTSTFLFVIGMVTLISYLWSRSKGHKRCVS